mmetsp:Transcript_11134/g.23470  ORF Transcript_11134/g.23470 Transcript_11134/m.23470 type:complete len:384 (+) Transcript_11134:35-1186(+)
MNFQYGAYYPNMGRGEGAGDSSRNIDPYQVLGVSRDATPAQIKKAYKKLALQHHPDKVRGDSRAKADANARFAEISHAYELLTRGGGGDAQQRQDGGAYQPDAADMAAGYYGPGQARYQPQQQQSMPFMGSMGFGMPGMGFGGGGGLFMDPFGAFGGDQSGFFGDPFGAGGRPGMTPAGFHFTDPFDLFRQTFGAEFGGLGGVNDPFGMGRGGATAQSGSMADTPPTSIGGGLFSSMLGGASMSAIPLNEAQGNFTSYSYSSSSTGRGVGGAMQTISTTTTINNNGKRVTRTERTTINPDGTKQTAIDMTGNDDDGGRPHHLLTQERPQALAPPEFTDTHKNTKRKDGRGRKRKFCEVTRCLKCLLGPSLRKRRKIGESPMTQ